MTTYENQVMNDYFDWLYDTVCKGRVYNDVSYRKLFIHLHSMEFTFSIRNDENRAEEGIYLRYRFAMCMDDERITNVLKGPCSILEMMVALAMKCETIMGNTNYGDRTSQWFWNMISNLGLNNMTDEYYHYPTVEEITHRFLDRYYEPDGKGGLFYIKDCQDDLRDFEIWTQMCWYLDKFV